MKRTVWIFLLLTACYLGSSSAHAVTIKEIVTMTRMGVSDQTIIKAIQSEQSVFHLNVSTIQKLRIVGVSSGVLRFMLKTPELYESKEASAVRPAIKALRQQRHAEKTEVSGKSTKLTPARKELLQSRPGPKARLTNIKKVKVPKVTLKEPKTERFFWSILAADLSSVALAGVNPGLGYLSFMTVSPIVHGANQSGRGLTSLGLRTGLPLLGALAGLGSREHEIGLVIGCVTASILDASLLAKSSSNQRTASKSSSMDFTANPTLGITPDGGLLMGLNGSF